MERLQLHDFFKSLENKAYRLWFLYAATSFIAMAIFAYGLFLEKTIASIFGFLFCVFFSTIAGSAYAGWAKKKLRLGKFIQQDDLARKIGAKWNEFTGFSNIYSI